METSSVESENISFLTATHQPENVDVDSLVNSLKQRAIFNVVADWSRKEVQCSNSVTPKNVRPLNLFITDGAGVSKSRLIETCHAFLTKAVQKK